MSDLFQGIGAAMRADAEAVRVIGQNVANSNTVAYRRQVAVTHSNFDSSVADARESLLAGNAARTGVAHDFRPAALQHTGNPTHVALEGAGFFMLDTDRGPVLTRRGDFKLSSDGTLLAASGAAVLGGSGRIQLDSSTPEIAKDGAISVGGVIVDRLRVVHVADDSSLVALGDGTFTTDPQFMSEGDLGGIVRQGFLESSNVVGTTEMVQLVETMRHFEFEQRFARAWDGMLNDAIRDLGKTT